MRKNCLYLLLSQNVQILLLPILNFNSCYSFFVRIFMPRSWTLLSIQENIWEGDHDMFLGNQYKMTSVDSDLRDFINKPISKVPVNFHQECGVQQLELHELLCTFMDNFSGWCGPNSFYHSREICDCIFLFCFGRNISPQHVLGIRYTHCDD